MGLMDGILGGAVGAGMASVVHNLIEKHGGLQGIVAQFEQQGLGATIKSWIGTGPNQPIAPAQVQQALGADAIKDLAAKTGISTTDLLAKLSVILPEAIDKMTPNGTIPAK